ncbi:MAG: lysostaphin resistance A-like protein [Xanthobacteraceae bacterium]
MADADIAQPPPPPQPTQPPARPWGYLATLAWGLLAALASAAVTTAALPLLIAGRPGADSMYDAQTLGIMSVVGVIAELVVVIFAVRRSGLKVSDYLGFVRPTRRQVVIAFATMIAFVATVDVVTVLLGKEVVTPFQDEVYRTADSAVAMLVLSIAVLVAAPVGEEIMFRGFLFRGWIQTPRDVIPVIVLTSALWSAMHSQYDWVGIAQIFLTGLLLGWLRWWSGSTLLVIGLHALNNIWATIQTIAINEWPA